VFPGLAVLQRLQDTVDVDVAWVGGVGGVERRIVTDRGVRYFGIPTGKLRRYLSLENLRDVFRVAAGVFRSVVLIRKLRPAVVFSKGGFVSVPPVVAAGLFGIPVISHESDADPGLATRINARFSTRICVAYESTRTHFRPDHRPRVVVTGNPLRPEIFTGSREAGLRFLGFAEDDPRPVVLFLGGSLGARQINELVAELGTGSAGTWRIVHQTGAVAGMPLRRDDHYASPFFRDELPDVLAAADLVVCRAGASTLWETSALGLPMLLVPLSEGSRGDQVRNAAIFERAGAARSFVRPESLADEVREALEFYSHDREALAEMGKRAQSIVMLDATDRIADIIAEYL
jgi:UDP-N-acetylglucosamine--N-acetylmuramyl-(pentapeptide) pyrophosphoryl-undecaprenol N-acetylglucosamine transferase